jgi:hypothetical protein
LTAGVELNAFFVRLQAFVARLPNHLSGAETLARKRERVPDRAGEGVCSTNAKRQISVRGELVEPWTRFYQPQIGAYILLVPQGSHFSCFAKKSNQKKATPTIVLILRCSEKSGTARNSLRSDSGPF